MADNSHATALSDDRLRTHTRVVRIGLIVAFAYYLPLTLAAVTGFPYESINLVDAAWLGGIGALCAFVYILAGAISRKLTKNPVARLYAVTISRAVPTMWLGLCGFAAETFRANATIYLIALPASLLVLAFGVWPRQAAPPQP